MNYAYKKADKTMLLSAVEVECVQNMRHILQVPSDMWGFRGFIKSNYKSDPPRKKVNYKHQQNQILDVSVLSVTHS